jgi:hypothetical protein
LCSSQQHTPAGKAALDGSRNTMAHCQQLHCSALAALQSADTTATLTAEHSNVYTCLDTCSNACLCQHDLTAPACQPAAAVTHGTATPLPTSQHSPESIELLPTASGAQSLPFPAMRWLTHLVLPLAPHTMLNCQVGSCCSCTCKPCSMC